MTVEELKIEAEKLGYCISKKSERKQKLHRRYVRIFSNNYKCIMDLYNSNKNLDECDIGIVGAVPWSCNVLSRGQEFNYCWIGRINKETKEKLIAKYNLKQINNSVLDFELI